MFLKNSNIFAIESYAQFLMLVNQATILSHASEAGSPTNLSGSDKTWGQGSFGPSTGGPDLHKNFKRNELQQFCTRTKPDQALVSSNLNRKQTGGNPSGIIEMARDRPGVPKDPKK